jgi:hypothetical protein
MQYEQVIPCPMTGFVRVHSGPGGIRLQMPDGSNHALQMPIQFAVSAGHVMYSGVGGGVGMAKIMAGESITIGGFLKPVHNKKLLLCSL